MNIGILFRGPIRPSITNVLANKQRLLANFVNKQWYIETWLSTWNTWLDNDVSSTILLTEFNAIISQPEPDYKLAEEFFEISRMPSTQTIGRLWKTMLNSKTALDAMVNCGRYNYIVHARTDGLYDFGKHLESWFDPTHISTSHVIPRINDFIQIGPSSMIRDVWDYGDINNLKKLIHIANSPEHLLQIIAESKGIHFQKKDSEYIWLDAHRNDGDIMR